MNADFTFALYVFCMDYHQGQNSRLYRIMSKIVSRGISMRDSHIYAIQGNRHTRQSEGLSVGCWEEWTAARKYYRELKQKFTMQPPKPQGKNSTRQ